MRIRLLLALLLLVLGTVLVLPASVPAKPVRSLAHPIGLLCSHGGYVVYCSMNIYQRVPGQSYYTRVWSGTCGSCQVGLPYDTTGWVDAYYGYWQTKGFAATNNYNYLSFTW